MNTGEVMASATVKWRRVRQVVAEVTYSKFWSSFKVGELEDYQFLHQVKKKKEKRSL